LRQLLIILGKATKLHYPKCCLIAHTHMPDLQHHGLKTISNMMIRLKIVNSKIDIKQYNSVYKQIENIKTV
jgi:hypothetical protein